MDAEKDARVRFIPLGQIASCQYGLSTKADPDGERVYIGMGQLVDGRVVVNGANRITVTESVAERYGLHVGDVLFNRTNSRELVGKTAIVADPKLGGAMFASYLVRLVIHEGKYSPEFLNIWMNTGSSAHQLSGMATPGVAQFNIRPSLLAQAFLVPDTPIVDQRNIVRFNAQCDAVLATLRALTTEVSTYQHGLAQQLLTGKKRFSEFRHSSARHPGEFGTFPVDWNVLRISDVAKQLSIRGATDDTVVYSCTKHDGLVPSLEYFGKQVFSRNLDVYKRLQPGDFAYATNHIEEGSIGLVKEGMTPGLVSPMYTTFRCDESINPEFLFAVLKTENYRRVFERRTSASVDRRGSLRWKEFSRIRVPVPTREEQDRIIAVLRLADSELTLLAQQREQYELYKRGLMSRLFSGDIQVPA